MNKSLLCGRWTKDMEVRYSSSDGKPIARGTLAVPRQHIKEGEERQSDFINCVAFGKVAEFLEKYGRKGTKFIVEGHIQTGSYNNREGQKVYTTEVVIENVEFAESKKADGSSPAPSAPHTDADGFMNIPDGIDEELPFN